MDALATLPTDLSDNLWMIVLGVAVVVHVVAVARAILRRRRTATRNGAHMNVAQVRAALGPEPAIDAAAGVNVEQAQFDRVLALVERSTQSAERMTQAHAAAAVHLDSAEYQLQRLFDEFPMLTPVRTRRPEPVPALPDAATVAAPALAA